MPKFNLSYHKVPNIHFKDLSFNGFQFYNPLYNELFNLDENSFNKITLNQKYQFISENQIYDTSNKETINQDYFIKYSPLVDPTKYMVGKYTTCNLSLPTIHDTSSNVYHKIIHFNNVSYIDNFFYYLSSQILNYHNFQNSIDYYGSFMCIKDKFKYDISDDLEYLYSSEFFNNNLNELFTITENTEGFFSFGSRANKKKLNISSSSIHNISACTLKSFHSIEEQPSSEFDLSNSLVYVNHSSRESLLISESDSETESSEDSEINYSSDEEGNTSNDDESEDEEEEEDDDDDEDSDYNDDKFAYLNNFPVQAICMEKCNGTLDKLFENELMSSHEGICALFQVIMTLICYQKMFYFTHNDLHTNNIMYKETKEPFLYYRYNKQYYKVPSYGKIYKIIDFGRSIFRFNNKLFCSDSFGPDGDAHTQYNCEPFFNTTKARIDPNFSFDLCRLGCSLYDFIIDEHERPEDFNDLQKIVNLWCTDDDNKNILYKKNGEERYPNFKLYKMIARTVHNHTPEKQLNISIFKQFECKQVINNNLMNIDVLPSYI